MSAADRKTVRFIGVDVEDDATKAVYFDLDTVPPIHYPSVVDPEGKLLLHYNPGPPTTLFVNPNGAVVYNTHGVITSESELRADIAKYLGVH